MKIKYRFLVVLSVVFFSAFFSSFISADAATYYISPSGNDNTGNGSISSPWASLEKLSSVLQAGDTGYVRGGTYRSITPNDENKIKINGLAGTSSNPIKIWAYTGEKPVFNLDNIPATQSGVGLYVSNSNYIHLKGLRVTGLKQCTGGCSMAGVILFNVDNSTVELFEIDNIEGYGLYLQGQQNPGGNGSDNNLIKNVDVHHIGDRYSGWGGANGFNITGGDLSNNNVFDGCRIWWSSDDGFDFFGTNIFATIKNSWSFWNGYQPGTFQTAGDGFGFKLGPEGNNPPSNQLRRVLTNNLAFENRVGGFDQNSGTSNTMLYRLHNNTSYGNGQFSYFFGANTNMQHDFKNNIAVGGSINGNEILSGTNIQTNSWNGNLVANSSDFISVSAKSNPNCLLATVTDTNCPNGPRQADGSLPNNNFLKLAPGSDLINAGTNVGLPYTGSAPDLGAFESGGTAPAPDTTAPTAAVTIPVNNVTVFGPINITATATDNIGVTKVDFYNGSTMIGTDNTSPYNLLWNTTTVPNGTQVLSVKSYDAAGNIGTSINTSIIVNNVALPAPDTTAPTIPTNLNGSASSTSQINLTWTASTDAVGVTGYKIYRNGTQVGTSTTTSYSNTGLSANTSYSYTVSAYDAAGNNSAQSTAKSVVTQQNTSNTPPTANAGSDQTITLPTNSVTLTGSGTDTGGSIYSYAWTKISTLAGVITSPSSASTTITGLVQGVHTFRIAVTDNGGLTTTDDVVVNVNGQAVGIFSMGQRVQVYGGSATVRVTPVGTKLGTQPVNALGTIIGGPVTANGYIRWNVDYDNVPDGWSAQTRLRAYTLSAPDTTAPTIPTNLNGSASSTSQINLTWTASTDAVGVTGYKIYRNGTQVGTSTTTSYSNTGLSANTSYSYTVSAYDAAGNNSAQSTAKSVVTLTQGTSVGITIPSSAISHHQGNSYQFIDSFGGILADNNQNLNRSTLRLYENGVEMTRAHASHYDIETIGQGRFSHWGEDGGTKILLFSASNNSNPGSNGKVYSYTLSSPTNSLPIANAGSDKTITLPTNSTTLSGTATDPDGNPMTYTWSKVSGGNATISSPNSLSTNITGLTQGTYIFWLTVVDSNGGEDADAVTVIVNPAPSGITIPSSAISHHQGNSYQFIDSFGGILADNNQNLNRSTLRLYENGVEMTRAHASHYDIETIGQGRFSHWGEDGGTKILLFSASNNSNPGSNGKVYSYTLN